MKEVSYTRAPLGGSMGKPIKWFGKRNFEKIAKLLFVGGGGGHNTFISIIFYNFHGYRRLSVRSRKAIAANLFVGYYNNFFRSTKWHQPNFFIFDFWVVKILKNQKFFFLFLRCQERKCRF